jgi:hypothetical protein
MTNWTRGEIIYLLILIITIIVVALMILESSSNISDKDWRPVGRCLHSINGTVTTCGVTETAAVHATQTPQACSPSCGLLDIRRVTRL